MQNNVISSRIVSLYRSQPSFVCFFASKTATLGPELQVSMLKVLTHVIHSQNMLSHVNTCVHLLTSVKICHGKLAHVNTL